MRRNGEKNWNLAIDTSCRIGSVTLGLGGEIVESVQLSDPMQNRGRRRNSVELMPVIEQLSGKHGFGPGDVGQLYVAVGPGSFTGLRISITTAKMFGQIHQTKLVAVPSVDIVAKQAAQAARESGAKTLAVCLNFKRKNAYTGLYDLSDEQPLQIDEPKLMTLEQILDQADGSLAIIGDRLPDFPDRQESGEVKLLASDLAQSQSETVWQLGQILAKRGEFTDHLALAPIYVRPPEAVELWDLHHPAVK